MEIIVVKIDVPEGCNIILGQSHFIKSVEDLHEAMVNSVPNVKFGVGFCESSGPCLVRHSGTDQELESLSAEYALSLGCGHCFIIFMKEAYPVNVLNKIKEVPEVCTIFAATANPVEVIIAETKQGRAILGIVDGFKSKEIETGEDIKARRKFLRKIGYKF